MAFSPCVTSNSQAGLPHLTPPLTWPALVADWAKSLLDSPSTSNAEFLARRGDISTTLEGDGLPMRRAGAAGRFLLSDRVDLSRLLYRSMGWRYADGRRRSVAADSRREAGW